MGGEITNCRAVVYMPKRRRPEECDADEAWSPWMFAFYRQIKAQSAVALDQAAKNERSVLLFCCRHR